MSRLVAASRRIEFVILRTASSPPGAPHLPPPPRGDAVTFGYGVVAYSGMDFHHADVAPLTGALIPAKAGIQFFRSPAWMPAGVYPERRRRAGMTNWVALVTAYP